MRKFFKNSFLLMLTLLLIAPTVFSQTLPLDFEDTNITYGISGFGGADPAEIIANPDVSGINTSATVAHISKTEGAEVWAGAAIPLAATIDLSQGSVFEMKVWSPRAGVPIMMKFEDTTSPPDGNGNPSIIAEVIANTTTSNEWEILAFDMSLHPGYSASNNYDQLVFFPDFGTAGLTGGESYYLDDIQNSAITVVGPTVPLDFEDTNITYQIIGFGAADLSGIPAEITTNPDMSGINTSATVAHINKPEGAQVWAGASIPLSAAIDLSQGSVFEVKVWSPRVDVPINLKFEDTTSPPDGDGNPSIIAEVVVNTTTSNEWEILVFDMALHPAYSANNNYDRLVLFPDFGSVGVIGGESYYFDDIQSSATAVEGPTVPIDFEDENISYQIIGFGSINLTAIPAGIIANPDMSGINTSATVACITKTEGAQVWAGAAISLDAPVDLSQGSVFEVKVWSPRTGVPIMLKFENTSSPLNMDGNPSIFAEVIVNTTTSNEWEILVFDMALYPDYSANNNYDRLVLFPDFGTEGIVGGESYYFDDIQVSGGAFCDQTINLNPGWNLISLDVSPADKAVQNLFNVPLAGNLEFVTSFDAGTITFDPNIPLPFNTLIDVEDGFGYWVKVTNAATLSFQGACIADDFQIPLGAGWNLIAYPPDAMHNTEVYFADLIADNNLEFVTGFDAGTVTFDPTIPIPFNTLQQLKNGFGYWVKVTNASGTTLLQGPTSPTQYPGMNLVWSDEFDLGAVDNINWTQEFGDNWFNNELQSYTNQGMNAWTESGNLVIEAREEPSPFGGSNQYTSARIITQDKFEFQYGRVDIRAAMPEGQGIWPALWTLGADIDIVSWPNCGEIDILEMIGGGTENVAHNALHWQGAAAALESDANSYQLPSGSLHGEYHVYSIIWNETSITYLIDDIVRDVIDIQAADMTEFHVPHFLIMNIAVGGDWPGNPDGTTIFPQRMIVDYVRVFQEQ